MIGRLRKLTLVLAFACALLAIAVTIALADSGTGQTTTVFAGTPTTGAPATNRATGTAPATIPVPKRNPFLGRAMWIWEISQTDNGDIDAIIAQARRYDISTLMIKSGDGRTLWSQFSHALVTRLHRAGLKVCAWQFIYGFHPAAEAEVAADSVSDGADCLVIDAESTYQGKYPAAYNYITDLRARIGESFPVGLTGFTFVDFHLNFPYSVFLGPDGAQYDLPQMYWKDIGDSVSYVVSHTYQYSEIYRRPIYPLGQLVGNVSSHAIEEFNSLASDFGAVGVSWWDWQSANGSFFTDIDLDSPPGGLAPSREVATIYPGGIGDPVIWAQQLLDGAGYHLAVDGGFGPDTEAAVESFQSTHGLPVTGTVDAATWDALAKVTPVSVQWKREPGGKLYSIISG